MSSEKLKRVLVIPDGAKIIKIVNRNVFAIIDSEDYERLSKIRWHLTGGGYITYCRKFLMHRLIMNAPKGSRIDHINGNPLDNRKSNLRFCNQSVNIANAARRKNCKSPYRGVQFTKRSKINPYVAMIRVGDKKKYLGCFPTAELAAAAYDKAKIDLYGSTTKINGVSA